jgi:CheY-like chemotaxis protein
MEAIGAMAGGIAHDFNNILGAILGYGELAQKSAAEGSAVRRYSDNVMHAAGRAKALVERILAFSRSGIGERAPVNVQAVIAETLDLLAASLPGRVQLERKLDAGDAAVIADATQFHQVVMNLCTNAVQAMPAGGVLEVHFERVEVAERVSVFQGELAPGPYVRLTVRDSGTGIEPQVLDRMFDPFFTTKGVGVGTGLGLSLVHGIVADVGGAIDVATAIDEGTTFTIWMPVAGAAPAPNAEVASELPHGNGEVIMVVDDEPSLVALTEEMLAELGYEPIGFESSTAALKAFAEDPGRFHLVLTDEMMPELSGTGLALEIRRLRANIPIVIMSGYVDTSVAALARSAGVSDVLRKPLQSRDIAEALARVLPVSGAATATAG